MKTARRNPMVPPTADVLTSKFDWDEVLENIQGFNGIKSRIEENATDEQYLKWSPDEILDEFDFHYGLRSSLEEIVEHTPDGNPAASDNLGFWILQNFGYKVYRNIQEEHRPIADFSYLLIDMAEETLLKEDWENMSEETKKSKGLEFLKMLAKLPPLMEDYAQEINKLLKQVYPERFKYEGFFVTNPDHFAKPLVNELLASVNFMKSWFRDRHLLEIFEKEIKEIRLMFQPPFDDWYARYTAADQRIDLSNVLKTVMKPRFMDSWIQEAMLHEFAHHIHMKYIHGAAKRFWDSWWDLVKEAQEIDKKTAPLTYSDRTLNWMVLIDSDYDPTKALKSFHDEADGIRFLAWLNNPSKGNKNKVTPYYNPGRPPRLTEYGKDMFDFYKDSYEFIEKHYPEALKDKPGHLGMNYQKKSMELQKEYDAVLGIDSQDHWPKLTRSMEKDIRGTTPTEVQAIDQLGVPSDYARKNELEDFAESFVLFVTEPRRLSELAQYRMKRTLSLSGLYGKPVMTFAKAIEGLMDKGMEEEAKDILVAYLQGDER